MAQKKKRANEALTEPHFSVIGVEGEQLGMMDRESAFALAREKSLDLVEVWVSGDVPLVKLMDYGKYLFRQQKSQSKNRTTSKKADMKSLRITYKIGEHDLQVKARQARKFAENRHPLKITLQLRGRENQFSDIAAEKMHHFVDSLSDIYKAEGSVKKMGNTFQAILYPR